MRRNKSEIMSGVDCVSSRVVGNNTVEYERENGERVIRLHLTDIITFRPDGSVVLDTGGWKTITTKARMNDYLAGWRVYQEKGEWYLFRPSDRETSYHFRDGVTVRGDTCDGEKFDPAKVREATAYRRRVRAYAKAYIKAMRAGDLPAPGPGDCWGCLMVDDDGRTVMGDYHIRDHIEEKYYVPSLLLRAVEEIPVSDVARWCIGEAWYGGQSVGSAGDIGYDQLEKSLYRYCVRHAAQQAA